jgi:4-hydroxy-tetrahydrodipicolinate synthase
VANERIEGIWAASVTAVDAEGGIDHARTIAHAQALLGGGCHGVALFGTTGEAPSFAVTARQRALDALLEAGIPAGRLLVGVGTCALADTLALARHALDQGVTRLLVLPPFYFKNVADAGVVAAYAELLERLGDARARIVLYHFPRLSGVPITPAVTAALLARFPDAIAGIKDSSGELEHTLMLIDSFPQLAILPGADHHLLDTLCAGGAGSISAPANLTARESRAVWDAWRAGEPDAAAERQATLTRLRRILEARPLVAAVKAVLARRLADPGWQRLRPPLTPLDEPVDGLVRALVEAGWSPPF